MSTTANRLKSQRGMEKEVEEFSDEHLTEVAKRLSDRRNHTRRIVVHEETEKAKSRKDAVVKRQDGNADLRIAENRNLFLKDPTKKKNNTPDNRLMVNRPDLAKVHVMRGNSEPNVIFSDDEDFE